MATSRKIKKWFEAHGHHVRKNHGTMYSVSGEPDLDIWLYYGNWQMIAIPIRVEVKRNIKDVPRPNQVAQMAISEAKKIACYVVWTESQCEQIHDYWKVFAMRNLRRTNEGKISSRSRGAPGRSNIPAQAT